MSDIWTNPNNGRSALVVAVAATILGVLWWMFLVFEPFNMGVLRIIPMIWLILALVACSNGLRAVSFNNHRGLGALSMLIGALNFAIAAFFLLAAMGG